MEDSPGGGHPAHRLRVRLADRALSSTNPLLALAGRLVELAGGRVTASDVLDLAGSEACRLRFGLGDDDLDRIARWVGQAGIRWGLDAPHRAAFSMARFEHNTWRAGLDRVLLGVAMSGDDHRRVGRGLPVDDVGSSDIDLVGRLAELVDRLDGCVTALSTADDAASWMSALTDGVRSLGDVAADDAWQLAQLERELSRAAAAAADGPGVRLRLADVRALLVSRLGGRPTRANFRTGTLTVCTMVPMRSVPHRVVCLVGLDDGVFPRSLAPDGDDVLARDPLTGERDVRSEDRQLLLDAVLAATETLVVTCTGANEHSGAPPAPRGPPGRGPRRRRPHLRDPGARARAHPPPAAALRRPQPGPRRAAGPRPATLQLRHRRAGRGPGRGRRAGPAAAAAGRGPAGASSPATSPWPSCAPSSCTRCAASCASASTCRPRWSPTRSATRSRSRSTRWRPGRSATTCCARCWRARTRWR